MAEIPDPTDAATSATGRRAFMAGAAGLAAGAALLAGASPAGASSTTAALDLFWVDESGLGPPINPVDLGTGGLAEGVFVAEGDLVALTVRIHLGTDADPGAGFWGLDGADFPSGYQPLVPAPAPFDVRGSWLGTGFVFDITNATQASYVLTSYWGDYSAGGGPAAGLLWFLPGLPGPPQRLNDAGTAPFGSALTDGTFVWSSMVYQRAVPEE
ncbi:MAG TPA: hypothetical protein VGO60_07600 [Iamia sp.]|jgi:hypothetical protein|nr:hypothetical protein [Iamia sp.]